MKTFKRILLLVPMVFLLCACPYSAEFALDEKPVEKIDPKLVGSWEPKENEPTYNYTVKKADDYNYTIDKITLKSGEVTSYKAFISKIDGVTYLNVIEGEGTTYYFYKVEFPNEYKVKLSSVTENIDEKFEKSADLKAFFKKNQGLSFFFEKSEDEYLRK
jgi:hypothetical protein